ncbi:hypothetical protein HJC23_008617 [Cyclotella cryptica]|uniref:Carbohydrate-binding module family 96 domain-containing protein n=1 Tax=Cyclotella cryptica TaxID=29204 RepID=A0ABD3Q8C5_9STRA
MLRGWGADHQRNEGEEIPSAEHHEPRTTSSYDIGVLREWSAPLAPYIPDGHEEKEEIEHEIGDDPLASPTLSSVGSGWSVPHGALEDMDAVSVPFGEEEPTPLNRSSGAMIDIGQEKHLETVPPKLQVMASALDHVDAEACTKGVPPSNNDCNVTSSISSHIRTKLNEIRNNPSAKFKVMVGISVFIVTVCVIAIAGAASSDNKSPMSSAAATPTKGSGIETTLGIQTSQHGSKKSKRPRKNDTEYPTAAPSIVASVKLTIFPTLNPTAIPTYALILSPTDFPTALQTLAPSHVPTLSPTLAPNTLSPTVDCSDASGLFLTYNGKPRDCTWLDNHYNGAKSARKDMNCLSSDLGDKCRYTCRLYNGCMDDLLSRLDTLTNENDFSIGNSCTDKPGTFMGNNHIPRNCSWLEEDPTTAPMKKSLNCGTPEDPRTELGAMCPGSCAGYNHCSKDISGDTGIVSADAYSHDDFPMKNEKVVNKDDNNDNNSDEGIVDNQPMPTVAPTLDTTNDSRSNMPSYLSTDPSKTSTPTVETCIDADGEFQTHVGPSHYRKCRWFNRDGDGFDVADKKRLNCHITEIGMNCLATCGCLDNEPQAWEVEDKQAEICKDPSGLFEIHDSDKLEPCDWLDTENSDEKKKLNCGITEIGNKCICRCPVVGHDPSHNVLIQDVSWDFKANNWNYSSVTPRPSKAPTLPPKKSEGQFDAAGKVLTLSSYADATVAEKDPEDNYGESLVLRVAPRDNKMHSLLLFDLAFVSKSFGTTFGSATLRLYATQSSTSGGVTFKQMTGSNWNENTITWNKIPGGEGSDELIVSFLNAPLIADTWYDVDLTAAVRDTLEHKQQYLSIRAMSDDTEASFASKERQDVQPQLIVDSETASPTLKPSYAPTYPPSMSPANPTHSPSTSPVVALDCLDHKGKFKTNTGESQSCSWFDIGNGELKKELNCQGSSGARMFCQSQCGKYNGCDDMTCEDRAGSYATHTGWRAECTWLTTGQGA